VIMFGKPSRGAVTEMLWDSVSVLSDGADSFGSVIKRFNAFEKAQIRLLAAE